MPNETEKDKLAREKGQKEQVKQEKEAAARVPGDPINFDNITRHPQDKGGVGHEPPVTPADKKEQVRHEKAEAKREKDEK